MKVKELKRIINLISTNGLVTEFIIRKDGNVRAIDPARTVIVDLKNVSVMLLDDIAFENSKKIKGVVDKFPDDTELEVKDNAFILKSTGKDANIPRKNIDTITNRPPDVWPEYPYALEVQAPLDKLKAAMKNKVDDLAEEYVFRTENNTLKVYVGNQETGWIAEDICAVPEDKNNLSCRFTMNIPQVITTLEKNPVIKMGNNVAMQLSYNTDFYEVKYLVAPRVDQT